MLRTHKAAPGGEGVRAAAWCTFFALIVADAYFLSGGAMRIVVSLTSHSAGTSLL